MLELLTRPFIAIIFCVIIIAFFYYARYLYDKNSRKLIAKSITEIFNCLNEIPNQTAFYEQYESIDSKLSENSVFKVAWIRFSRTIVVNTDKKEIVLTQPPHEYFNEYSIIAPIINLRLWLAFPNFIVGGGLVLTFIGLVLAIYVASTGLGSADGGQEALKKLLNVASVKFLSSIAALICSIFLTRYLKLFLNNLNKQIYNICYHLERLTSHITTEVLLNDTLKVQKDQTNILEHLATKISMEIANALADKLPASVALAMQPLAEALNNAAQKLTATNHDGLEQMLNSFTKKLDTAAQGEIQELVRGLKNMQESLQILLQQIQLTGDNFGSKVIGAAGQLTHTLTPVSENLLTFNDTIKMVNEKMYAQLDRFENNVSLLNTTFQNIKQVTDHFQQASQPLSNVAEGMTMTIRSAETAYKQIQEANIHSQQATTAIQQVSEKVIDVWQSYQDRFKSVDEDMAKAFTHIHDGLDIFRKNISEFVSQFDDKFANAIRLLEGSIRDLADEREEIQSRAKMTIE